MHVVELLERLGAQGIELVWWDAAGAVWNGGRPSPEAEPWVAELSVPLMYAVRGAGTGHQWGACSACDQAQLVPTKAVREATKANDPKPRKCRLTPHCPGTLGRWVELPTAVQAWATLKATRKLAQTQADPSKVGMLGAKRTRHRGRTTEVSEGPAL